MNGPKPNMVDGYGATMTPVVTRIHDPNDARVAELRRLNDGKFRREVEAPGPFSLGLFVAEGWLVLERAIGAGCTIRAVLVLEARLDRLMEVSGLGGCPVFVVDATTMRAVVGFDLHRGVVAVAQRRRLGDLGSVVGRSDRLMIVEGVSDTENLGALFRNAAGLGATAAVIDSSSADPWARRVVRTSMGHVLTVPWCRSPTAAALTAAGAAGHRIVALTPSGDVELSEVEVDDSPVTVVVGAEGPGLSDASLGAASLRVRIDMAHEVDSLNVATAAAVAMWHLFGRRHRFSA